MYGDKMHKVDIPHQFVRTDLILEQDTIPIRKIVQETQPGVFVTHMKTKEGLYSTIEFQDITDHVKISHHNHIATFRIIWLI